MPCAMLLKNITLCIHVGFMYTLFDGYTTFLESISVLLKNVK